MHHSLDHLSLDWNSSRTLIWPPWRRPLSAECPSPATPEVPGQAPQVGSQRRRQRVQSIDLMGNIVAPNEVHLLQSETIATRTEGP